MNGSSWSLRASSAASFEMPAFLKQYLTVVSGTSDHEEDCMASKLDVVWKPFLMSRWMIFRRYFALRYLITPWSIGWVYEVVIDGRNISSTAFKPSILGCAGQLSKMSATFRFSLSNLFIKFLYPFVKNKAILPTFCLSSITAWETIVHVFETPRFTDFPITSMGSFSPAELAAAVRRKLYLPSAHFSTFMCKVIWGGLGRTGQIHPRYIYLMLKL